MWFVERSAKSRISRSLSLFAPPLSTTVNISLPLLSMSSQSSSSPSKTNTALVPLAVTKLEELVGMRPSGDSALSELESWGKKWVVVLVRGLRCLT
jgi:hypothetical protein